MIASLIAAVVLMIVSAQPIQAQFTIHYTHWDLDEETIYWIVEDDGNFFYIVTDEDIGLIYIEEIEDPGNPNPEDGTTSPGDADTQRALLKQQGGRGYLTPMWEDTILGAWLGNRGIGPGNYHNPSDEGDDWGISPSGIDFKHPMEDALLIGGRGSLAGIEFDPNGGSPGRQVVQNGKKQGTTDTDTGNDDSPQGSPFFDEFMVGPPELINPNPARGSLRHLPGRALAAYDNLLFHLFELSMDD